MVDAEADPVAPNPALTTQGKFSLGEHDPDPVPGTIGDRYELGRLLGRGATSRVFRAYDRETGKHVAIKLFNPETVALDEHRRLQEIRILGALRHPGLVELYDAGSENGQPYLAMELVEGPNLADRIAMGPLTTAEVNGLASSLADALAHVHAHGITHRDLKPANVLLDADRPLISDFGIAQAYDSTRITATGAVVGTAAYMAPEQVLGDKVGPPADIYALGLMLLECLTGMREYLGSMVESAVVRLHRPPRIPAGLPQRLEDLLRQMTSLRPDARPSAQTVLTALRDTERTVIMAPVSPPVALAATDEATKVFAPVSPPARTRNRRVFTLLGLPVLAAVIAASATILLNQQDDAVSPAQPPSSSTATPAPTPSSEPAPGAASIVVAPPAESQIAGGSQNAASTVPPPAKEKGKKPDEHGVGQIGKGKGPGGPGKH
jgi:serine/threonine protein kinase